VSGHLFNGFCLHIPAAAISVSPTRVSNDSSQIVLEVFLQPYYGIRVPSRQEESGVPSSKMAQTGGTLSVSWLRVGNASRFGGIFDLSRMGVVFDRSGSIIGWKY
jgi:hypothetical protein